MLYEQTAKHTWQLIFFNMEDEPFIIQFMGSILHHLSIDKSIICMKFLYLNVKKLVCK